MQPNTATGSYGIQPLASLNDNTYYIYGLNHVCVATYGHIYPCMQYRYTQIVHEMTFQCIYRKEADAHYTKLTNLRCNNT